MFKNKSDTKKARAPLKLEQTSKMEVCTQPHLFY